MCIIINFFLGLNDVSVDVVGFGSVLLFFIVILLVVISSVILVLGSVYGGIIIFFMENGFIFDVIVSILGVVCEVKSVSLLEMKCIIGVKVVGSYLVNV